MRMRYVLAGVLGLLVAGVAVFSAKVSLLQEESAIPSVLPDMIDVYVAAGDIPFGAKVTEDLVSTQSWPREAVPHVAFTDPALLFPEGEGPRRAKGVFVPGELLIAAKLSAFGADIPAVVPRSTQWRAMAIRARGEAISASLISPGDQVDVVFAHGKGREMRAVTLLQGIRVLGLTSSGLVTLEVTPEGAQSLTLAQEAGVLVVVLHTGGENPTSPLDTIDLRALLQEEVPVADPPAQTGRPVIVVRRGNETTVEPVERASE